MKLIVLPVMLGLGTAAQAAVFGPGPGGPIPDNLVGCNVAPATAFTSVINIPNAGTVTSVNSVTITGAHTYVGDFVVTLTAPNGDNVQVISRTGGPTSAGDSSNFAGPYVYQGPATTPTFTAAAATVGDMVAVPAGTYGREQTPAATQPPADTDNYTVFNGDPVTGNWTLRVEDWCGQDTGSITSWSIDISIGGGTCSGDVNNSGAVDVDDLVQVILDWGSPDTSGVVDVDDLVGVILGWGPCP